MVCHRRRWRRWVMGDWRWLVIGALWWLVIVVLGVWRGLLPGWWVVTGVVLGRVVVVVRVSVVVCWLAVGAVVWVVPVLPPIIMPPVIAISPPIVSITPSVIPAITPTTIISSSTPTSTRATLARLNLPDREPTIIPRNTFIVVLNIVPFVVTFELNIF
jgi:hypothetical protein